MADFKGAALQRAMIKNLEELEMIKKMSEEMYKARLVKTDIEKYYEII